MTNEQCRRPDLLRRFVPTPYVFSKRDGTDRICIESNDLEVALGIWRSAIIERQRNQGGAFLCKLIRDKNAPVDVSQILIVSDGALRVLYLGRGTILIHDHKRSEILGFISRNVKVPELVLLLIPALLDLENARDWDRPAGFAAARHAAGIKEQR